METGTSFFVETMPIEDLLALLRRAMPDEDQEAGELAPAEVSSLVQEKKKKTKNKKERKAERQAVAQQGGASASPIAVVVAAEPEELLPAVVAIPYIIRHNVAVDVQEFGGDIEKALKRFKKLSSPILFDVARGVALKTGDDARRFQNNNFRHEPPELSGLGAALVRSKRKEMWTALKEGMVPLSRRQRLRELERQRALAAAAASSATVLPAPMLARGQEISATQTTSTPALREEVLVVIEFLTNPPTYGMVWDLGKPKLGFIFGGKDDPDQALVDQELHVAAEREAMEELFAGVAVALDVTPQNMLGTIPGKSNGAISVFHVQVPAGTPFAKGVEQRDAFAVSQEQVDQWVRDRLVLQQHIDGWRFFKQTVLLPRMLETI